MCRKSRSKVGLRWCRKKTRARIWWRCLETRIHRWRVRKEVEVWQQVDTISYEPEDMVKDMKMSCRMLVDIEDSTDDGNPWLCG